MIPGIVRTDTIVNLGAQSVMPTTWSVPMLGKGIAAASAVSAILQVGAPDASILTHLGTASATTILGFLAYMVLRSKDAAAERDRAERETIRAAQERERAEDRKLMMAMLQTQSDAIKDAAGGHGHGPKAGR